MPDRLTGLIAAVYTPLNNDESIRLAAIEPLVEQLLADGVNGLYVCGSTGEGVSMSIAERKAVADAFIAATDRRVPVIVHVGHNSLTDAADLAEHAQSAGATATSAIAPNYFRLDSLETLVECIGRVAAAAPELPFYYYHIPAMTDLTFDMVDLLQRAGERIPNFTGLKYTARSLDEYAQCVAMENGRFDVLYGYDEMLLPALAVGAQGAVGTTYNIAAPLYRRVIEAFAEGDLATAQESQLRAIEMIRVMLHYPFHAAVKAVLEMLGTPCGPCRLPLASLTAAQIEQLEADLREIGFFQWARSPAAQVSG